MPNYEKYALVWENMRRTRGSQSAPGQSSFIMQTTAITMASLCCRENIAMPICPFVQFMAGEIETATSYLIPAPGSQCSEPLPLSLNTYILSPQSKVGPEKSCVELRFLLELRLNLNMNTRNTAGCWGVPWCPVAWVVLPGYKQPGVGGGECSSLCVSPASSQHNYQGVLFCVWWKMWNRE